MYVDFYLNVRGEVLWWTFLALPVNDFYRADYGKDVWDTIWPHISLVQCSSISIGFGIRAQISNRDTSFDALRGLARRLFRRR